MYNAKLYDILIRALRFSQTTCYRKCNVKERDKILTEPFQAYKHLQTHT